MKSDENSTKAVDAKSGERRTFLKGLSTIPVLGMIPSMFAASGAAHAEEAAEGAATGNEIYHLDGNYFEACNCDAICPCLLLDDPTHGYCQAMVSWHINKGHLGDLRLDDLNVVAWLHAPDNLVKGNWRLALYIDDRASAEQAKAIEELWGGKHGGYLAVIASLVSEVMGVRQAKIDWVEDGKHRHFHVEGVGGVDMTAIAGADGKDVVLRDMPLAVAPPNPVTISTSKHVRYNDYGADQLVSGTNGLSSPFTYFS